jgi:biotin synthase
VTLLFSKSKIQYFGAINQRKVDKSQIISLLQSHGVAMNMLFKEARETRDSMLGNKVYFRGLIELSNVCAKDCLYCGIRKSNENVARYNVSDDEVYEASRFAWENGFGSVVLQSGELSSPDFINRIERLLKGIKKLSNGELGITLSCGEQTRDTYQRWFESGAHRYLLRIEATNRELYKKIHPNNDFHSFERRLEALELLRETRYQVGTGVMIGLPFQTYEDLAGDLLFFKQMDIDMCGMGPYLEHEDTPLYEYRHLLMPKTERFDLSLKMLAVLRLLMPDINMASSTALQSIDPAGREKGLQAGANIIMPNLTPTKYREGYLLYKNKPGLDADALSTTNHLKKSVIEAGCVLGLGEWGDSKHFFKRG